MKVSIKLSRETPAPAETATFVKFFAPRTFCLPTSIGARLWWKCNPTNRTSILAAEGSSMHMMDGGARRHSQAIWTSTPRSNKWIAASAKALGRRWKSAKIQIMRHGAGVDVKVDFSLDDVGHWQRHEDNVLLGDFLRPPELPSPVGNSLFKAASKQ